MISKLDGDALDFDTEKSGGCWRLTQHMAVEIMRSISIKHVILDSKNLLRVKHLSCRTIFYTHTHTKKKHILTLKLLRKIYLHHLSRCYVSYRLTQSFYSIPSGNLTVPYRKCVFRKCATFPRKNRMVVCRRGAEG